MADDRRGPLVIGVLTALTGGLLFLVAGDVVSVPDRTFGAPRWLLALFALGFFFGGAYLVACLLPTSRMRPVLGGASVLAFLSAGALLMTWMALTGGGPALERPIAERPGSITFSPAVGRAVTYAFLWLFAIPLDVLALVAWFIALRWLVRRPAP